MYQRSLTFSGDSKAWNLADLKLANQVLIAGAGYTWRFGGR
jgi:hypothetical protein